MWHLAVAVALVQIQQLLDHPFNMLVVAVVVHLLMALQD